MLKQAYQLIPVFTNLSFRWTVPLIMWKLGFNKKFCTIMSFLNLAKHVIIMSMYIYLGNSARLRPNVPVYNRLSSCSCCMYMSRLHAHDRAACACQYCMSMSVLHVHVYAHAAYLCPCCMPMSMVHVHVHGACPCPWCMSMSMVHVHVHGACPCPCCMSMSMLQPSISIALTVYFMPPPTLHLLMSGETKLGQKALQYSVLLSHWSVTAQWFSPHHQHLTYSQSPVKE
jgi:hypothetical protein